MGLFCQIAHFWYIENKWFLYFDFESCNFILYLFFSFNNFDGVFKFFCKQDHLICEQTQCCFFPNWVPLIPFSFLFALARISTTMLNKSGACGHPCLVLDLRSKAFNFSSLSMLLVVGLSYTALLCQSVKYYVKVFLHTHSAEFWSWKDAEFCQILFLHIFKWSYNFYLAFY